LHLVMGTCVLFSHWCSNSHVPAELDLILNVLNEYMETI